MILVQRWIQPLAVVTVGVLASTLTLVNATTARANEPTNSNSERLQQEKWQLVRYNQQPVVADDD
ncbi:MAG: hypothetical protein AAFY72_11395, partial [Cyanobacteria bacterium J06649_4]